MITITIPIDLIAIIIATMFYFIGVFTVVFKIIDSIPRIDSTYDGFLFFASLVPVWGAMALYAHLLKLFLN